MASTATAEDPRAALLKQTELELRAIEAEREERAEIARIEAFLESIIPAGLDPDE